MSGPAKPSFPFDDERYIGTISQVGPSSIQANLPLAGRSSGSSHHGIHVGGGEVGEFVLIECDELAVFGRVIDIRLPERERLSVEPALKSRPEIHPVGNIQMLTTIDLASFRVTTGISRFPRLGSRVFSAHPDFISWLISQPRHVTDEKRSLLLSFSCLPQANNATVSLTPEQIFGRHCAILGTTGGGKSWSLSRILQEVLKHRSKVILLDATGEFWRLSSDFVQHVFLGDGSQRPSTAEQVYLPHFQMTEEDLFAIFRPSGQSQGPKLRQAIKSLKLAHRESAIAPNGIVIKAQQRREFFDEPMRRHAAVIDLLGAPFLIQHLPRQLREECVFPNSRNSAADFGDYSTNEETYCVSLQVRMESIISSPEFACVFRPRKGMTSIVEVMDKFIGDESKRLLRLSLQHVPFANHVREIVVNSIGRHLLMLGRSAMFQNKPLVVVLDEAHQFLNRTLGDEILKIELDAFGLIAKEGRKHGLTVCISTQRPRDIPPDVLSQMGTLIVHRLVNELDRNVVESAAGDIDRSAAAFLPTLAPGEAIIVGVDVPVPMSLKIEEPIFRPDSSGPDYQKCWAEPAE